MNVNINEVYNSALYWQEELKKYPPYITNDPVLENNRNYALNELNNCNRILEQYQMQQMHNVPVYNAPQQPTPNVGWGVNQNRSVFHAANLAAKQYGGMQTVDQTVCNTGGRYTNTNRVTQPQYSEPQQKVVFSNQVQSRGAQPVKRREKRYAEDSELDLVTPFGASIMEVEDKNDITYKVVKLPDEPTTCSVQILKRIKKLKSESELNELASENAEYDMIPVTIEKEFIVKSERELNETEQKNISNSLLSFKEIRSGSDLLSLTRHISILLPNFNNFVNCLVLNKFNSTLYNSFGLDLIVDDVVTDFIELEKDSSVFNEKHLKIKPPAFYLNLLLKYLCSILGNLEIHVNNNGVKIIYKEPVIFLANDKICTNDKNKLILRSDSYPGLFDSLNVAVDILDVNQAGLGIQIISYDDKSCKYDKRFNVYKVEHQRNLMYVLDKA